MATISVSLPADGDTIDVADYNTPVTTIVNAINGNLDNDNIAAAAAIAGTKLADSAITTVKIADEAVTPAKLLAGTGTDWVWQSWTPTWTNVSGGTLNYAKYIQIGKTVHFRIKYTLGGAGVSGGIIVTTPTSINAGIDANNQIMNISALMFDTGTAGYPGIVRWNSSTTIQVYAANASGTYLATGGTNATVPFTWASTDVISITGTYEAA